MGEIYFWIGALVFWALAGGVVVSFIAALYGILAVSFWHWVSKLKNGAVNWRAVYDWDRQGRPEFQRGDDGCYRVWPSAPPHTHTGGKGDE